MGWLANLAGKKSDGSQTGERVTGAGLDSAGASAHSGESAIGRKIGKYEVVSKIGAGGFGTVYEAFDPLIQRKVAIKTCEVGSPEIRARTFQEAQLAGRLQHPNITTVYEFGVEDDVPFIVQEFLSGEDLDQLIVRGEPVLMADKLKILVGVALGLEYAHKAGVMHRDIKPANIRVLEGYAIKIMDFGIAKAANQETDITKAGVAVGSAGYMSPEQICGDPVDHRTDIFSFGLLAYELLTRQKAFRNETLFKLLEMIVKEEPTPLEEFAPDTPPALADIVRRCMRKDPSERFQTARELRDALLEVHEQVPSTPAANAHPLMPPDEASRLAALYRFDILDSDPEPEFDDVARLAALICDTPIALVTFIDRNRQWFKSRIGVDATETSREHALCAHAILGRDVFVIPDTTADDRFSGNPLVTGPMKLRFYAGAPLVTPDGHAIGTICVLDREPRQLGEAQVQALAALARQAVSLLELRRRMRIDRGRSGEALVREASGITGSERRP
ncbi:MAG: protein kinase [Acidobacteriota bacterium]